MLDGGEGIVCNRTVWRNITSPHLIASQCFNIIVTAVSHLLDSQWKISHQVIPEGTSWSRVWVISALCLYLEAVLKGNEHRLPAKQLLFEKWDRSKQSNDEIEKSERWMVKIHGTAWVTALEMPVIMLEDDQISSCFPWEHSKWKPWAHLREIQFLCTSGKGGRTVRKITGWLTREIQYFKLTPVMENVSCYPCEEEKGRASKE